MYQDKYSSSQLSLNAKFGLQRVYDVLNKTGLDGVSLDDFINQNQLATSDLPFAELLKTNLNNIDTDKNQIISREEITNLINSISSKGLTYDQLRALAGQESSTSGNSKTLLSTVLENFNKVDANHDGHISEEEITAYQFNKEVEDKKADMYEFKASDISLFYEDTSTNTDESADTSATSSSSNNSSTTY